MTTNNKKGTPLTTTFRQQVIVNYCRTVLRTNDDLLQHAISQYQQSLRLPQSR